MVRRNRRPGSGLVLLAVCVAIGAATGDEPRETPKVHADGKLLELATIDLTRALLRADAPAVRVALEKIHESCRLLKPEEQETFGSSVRSIDLAFHAALDRARENASREDLEAVFDGTFWVQRTCLNCHEVARAEGRLPQQGPLWRGAEPFAP